MHSAGWRQAPPWYGPGSATPDDCSATSGCTAKAFSAQTGTWQLGASAPSQGDTGFRLTIEAALQIGRAIFVPMLAGPATNLTKLQEGPNR